MPSPAKAQSNTTPNIGFEAIGQRGSTNPKVEAILQFPIRAKNNIVALLGQVRSALN